jgi:hypothetical protein
MSAFLTAGADPYAHLAEHLKSVPTPAFQGTWTTVDIQPDPFAPQKFTVGVAVADLGGAYVFRLLDDYSKFDCVYGREDVAAIRSTVDQAEYTLLRARNTGLKLSELVFDGDALSLGPLWPTAGTSIDAVLQRLYLDVVPFVPSEERKGRDFVTLDNAAVRQRVNDELKRIAGISFEKIVSDHHRAVADVNTGQMHWLDFNLEPPAAVGSVISAVYKTADRIELNFLRASRDLGTFSRLRKLTGKAGIFVMMPVEDSMPSDDFARVEHVVSEQSWNLEQQGFVVAAHDAAAALADEVWEWAKPSIAGEDATYRR